MNFQLRIHASHALVIVVICPAYQTESDTIRLNTCSTPTSGPFGRTVRSAAQQRSSKVQNISSWLLCARINLCGIYDLSSLSSTVAIAAGQPCPKKVLFWLWSPIYYEWVVDYQQQLKSTSKNGLRATRVIKQTRSNIDYCTHTIPSAYMSDFWPLFIAPWEINLGPWSRAHRLPETLSWTL